MATTSSTQKIPASITTSRSVVAEAKAPSGTAMAQTLKELYAAKLNAAIDKAKATRRPKPEVAVPQGPSGESYWDIITIGVFQNGLVPGDVIKAGQPAGVLTAVILNPFYPYPIDACTLLSNFSLPFEVTYQTGDVTNWKKGPAQLNLDHDLTLVPGQCFYLDYLEFTTDDLDEVMYEMNVSARIFGCGGDYSPFFAGFSREVIDVDTDMFLGGLPMGFTPAPLRFMVAGPKPPTE